MPAPDLVRVGAGEWQTFRDVRLASLSDAPGAFGARHADWVGASEERWRSRLTDVPFTVVARSEGRGVGVVSGAPSESHVELISMWVAPDHRGTGLAGRLLDEVSSWASARGQGTCLMVRDDNTRAIRAYERAGFTDLGVPDDWPDDAPRERRMRRDVIRTGPPPAPSA
jgi:ribosomal protein S18 acetylase RimI-like enzyme